MLTINFETIIFLLQDLEAEPMKHNAIALLLIQPERTFLKLIKWTHCALVLDFECNPVLNECRTDEWNIQTYYRRTDFFRIVKVTKFQNVNFIFCHFLKKLSERKFSMEQLFRQFLRYFAYNFLRVSFV